MPVVGVCLSSGRGQCARDLTASRSGVRSPRSTLPPKMWTVCTQAAGVDHDGGKSDAAGLGAGGP